MRPPRFIRSPAWRRGGGVAPGRGVAPGVVCAGTAAGFSGETSVILQSSAARFSSGTVGPPFSYPRHSTFEILPSPAVNALIPVAVNVYFDR